MEVRAAKEKKVALQEAIRSLLKQFHNETDLAVTDVYVGAGSRAIGERVYFPPPDRRRS